MEDRKDKRRKEDDSVDEEDEQDKNQFSNDGSFLELFKAKMKENAAKDSKGNGRSNPTSCSGHHQQSIKSIQARGVGKPKALQKSLELREKRKRHREEIEEQKRREESEQGEEGKAWRKYLAEMKEYEERLCIDKDSGNRPLVK